MIQSILVPLDGSSLSEQALPWAFDLAEKYAAQVILLRVGILPDVWSPQDAPDMDTRLDELETQCMRYLLAVEARFKERNLPIKAEYGVGNATQRIVERSQQPDCSLIVMNSHGRDGFTRWMIGSVAEKVARHAGCPVLLIRKPEADQK
ncbi:MAG: universal stress protein [Candidatus Eremiobacteraeota bacterium]|nr:universal stress protein [Candidatus Eremiobacteraeota bacterium]